MEKLHLNGSGYYDPTAYYAMKNIMKEEVNKVSDKKIKGDIWCLTDSKGREKKALVVSSDERASDAYINIIMLYDDATNQDMIPIRTIGGDMYANPNMVSLIKSDSLEELVRSATDEEIKAVDDGIKKAFGLKDHFPEHIFKAPLQILHENPPAVTDIEARTEARIYKQLYEDLLKKVICQ